MVMHIKLLNVSLSMDSWQSSIKKNYFILIQGQYCAVFEEGLGRVIVDLYTNCPECPMIYSSDESWKCKLYLLARSSGSFLFNFTFKSYRFRFLMYKNI